MYDTRIKIHAWVDNNGFMIKTHAPGELGRALCTISFLGECRWICIPFDVPMAVTSSPPPSDVLHYTLHVFSMQPHHVLLLVIPSCTYCVLQLLYDTTTIKSVKHSSLHTTCKTPSVLVCLRWQDFCNAVFRKRECKLLPCIPFRSDY